MKKVCVLMSTYNGEKYLAEQLDSIFLQSGVHVSLIVRDDGSVDRTVSILKEYQKLYDITLFQGKNLKPAQSFRELIVQTPPSYDYYAYADQDDIWLKDKLSNAVRMIDNEPKNTPVLWYSGLMRYENGMEQQTSCCPLRRSTSIATLTKTFASTNGCTMVFNKKLLTLLQSCKSGQIDMHDSWTHAMCLVCGGRVLCDPTPYVKYRIHEAQVLGNKRQSVKGLISSFFNAKGFRSETVRTMLSSKYIDAKHVSYLNMLVNYRKSFRIKICLIINTIRNDDSAMTEKERIKFMVQILTNKF